MHRVSEIESALAAAREALPWWAPWLPALIVAVYSVVVLGFAFPLLSTLIAAGRLLQAPADLHWTDRAAWSWPGRAIAGINLIGRGRSRSGSFGEGVNTLRTPVESRRGYWIGDGHSRQTPT